MNRRKFLKSGILATATVGSGLSMLQCSARKSMPKPKRELILSLINEDKPQDYFPAGFFIHFGEGYKSGEAAIQKHLEYFRFTNMDFMKIQYEKTFPKIAGIQKPSDWASMPLHKKDFYEEPLTVIKGIVKEAKKEAPVIATFYSPFACAGHTTSDEIITRHLEEDPEQTKKGLEIITESLLIYVEECIKLGVDGFLQSTQGGEGGRFTEASLFTEYVKPFDLIAGREMEAGCSSNILHICDHLGNYDDYSAFVDYPGHIINCSLDLTNDQTISSKEMYQLFNRPFMGGMHKRGVMASGTQDEISSEVSRVLSQAPEKFVLAASCTLPGNIDWANIKTAIDTAHLYQF
jgi:uroporphyrinogen decarboxylase